MNNILKLTFCLIFLVLLAVFGSRRGIYLFDYPFKDDKSRSEIIEKCKKNKSTSKKCKNAYEAERNKAAIADDEKRRKKRKKRNKS